MVSAIKARLQEFYGDDSSKSKDYGRIINARHHARLVSYLDGQTIALVGDYDAQTRFFSPTVLLDPSLDSLVMREEIFGPILPVVSVDNIDSVIDIVNARSKPLALMAEATTFYLQLGFTQIVDTPHYARFECPTGEATFSVSLSDDLFENGAIIYFEHKALDEWVEELKSKGIEFDQDPTDESYLWREAVLRDPSGNKIKLYWAGENRLNPPWRVSKNL